MPVFDKQGLAKLNATLASFHTHKHAILATGACSEHFQIPKLELMQYIVPSICVSGAPMQWAADVTKHAHVTEIKVPARTGNNQNYYAQIAHHLNCSERCFKFNLVIEIASSNTSPNDSDNPNHEDHDPNDKKYKSLTYSSPVRKTVNYFKIADQLANGTLPNVPRPHCTFMSSTTTIHLATKSHH
ncbi:hypothetical protein JVU11DRAFT_6264 [Chiua virens]|nr:hypothetical protein JVU11DRAFT_6264 [Chiua virens]